MKLNGYNFEQYKAISSSSLTTMLLKIFFSKIQRWFHYKQDINIHPIQKIKTDTAPFDWCSQGDDSAFTAKPIKGPKPEGWYMLEIKVRSTCAGLSGKLSCYVSGDLGEDSVYRLPLVSGKLLKKVVLFPPKLTSIHFTPCENVADFTVEHFRFCKLTGYKARQLMIKKVERWHPEFKLEAENLMLEALREAYSECFRQQPLLGTYQQWIERVERPLFGELDQLISQADNFSQKPLISVVMPVYNVPERFLREAIESVRKQIYSNWELCIADDCSTKPHIQAVLNEYAAMDDRIKVDYRSENGHISRASSSAMKLATGDYVALLDHDDTLAPHALFCIVEALNTRPNTEFLYSDEDFIDEDGHRIRPHFKSQWNPELLNAHNYITHLAVIKRELVSEVGGFRVGFEGAQDYDLFLRITKQLSPEKICHIPHVLYHWRAIEGSTASEASAKNYATDAGLKALQDARDEVEGVTVSHDKLANFYRICYPLPEIAPLVSIIIPTRNGLDIIKPCVESILNKTTYQNFEILIVDNQSDEQATLNWFKHVEQLSNVKVLQYDQPFNYSAINNFAVTHAKGEVIALVNNDIEVITPGWLTEMVSLAIREENGCIGAKLYYPDGDIQHAGVILGLGGYAAHSHRGLPGDHPGYFNRTNVRQNLSAVTGACLVVRKEVFDEVSGLESSFTVAYNDVDFCLKVRAAGYRNVFTPFAELYHHESKSRGFDDTPEKQARFRQEKNLLAQRWGGLLKNDPYYSPNLTRSREDFSISV